MTTPDEVLIRGGTLVEPLREVREADILIRQGRIARVGQSLTTREGKVIEATGKIVMPGLISSHTHISSSLDRGLLDHETLDGWLLYTSSDAVSYTEREKYVISALGATELLKNGCTALVDHTPVNPLNMAQEAGSVASACADVGVRALIAPLFMDLHFSETLPLHLVEHTLEEARALRLFQVASSKDEIINGARDFIKEWSGREPLIRVGLGPSGPQRCSDGLLRETFGLAAEFDIPVHTHLCETKAQALKGFEAYGSSTIQHLHNLGFLSARTALAHVVWIDQTDIELMAETGARAVHNPIANMKLGSGVAPLPALLDAGVSVGLGADSSGCGDNLDMFEVVKVSALLNRLHNPTERWISAEEALALALRGGAAVMEQNVGTLDEGAEADLVMLDATPYFRMAEDGYMLRQLVYANSCRKVETVLVGGKSVIDSGEAINLDASDLRSEAQEIVNRMAEKMPVRKATYAKALPLLERIGRRVRDTPLDPFGPE